MQNANAAEATWSNMKRQERTPNTQVLFVATTLLLQLLACWCAGVLWQLLALRATQLLWHSAQLVVVVVVIAVRLVWTHFSHFAYKMLHASYYACCIFKFCCMHRSHYCCCQQYASSIWDSSQLRHKRLKHSLQSMQWSYVENAINSNIQIIEVRGYEHIQTYMWKTGGKEKERNGSEMVAEE